MTTHGVTDSGAEFRAHWSRKPKAEDIEALKRVADSAVAYMRDKNALQAAVIRAAADVVALVRQKKRMRDVMPLLDKLGVLLDNINALDKKEHESMIAEDAKR